MSNAVANGLAGAGGGIIAQIITYPLQTVSLSSLSVLRTRRRSGIDFAFESRQVNTRQQTERVAKKGLSSADKKTLPAQTRPAAGTLLQIIQVLIWKLR